MPKTRELSQDQLLEIQEAFTFFDKDGNGIITGKELNAVMNSLGYYPTEEQSNAMMQKIRSFGRETIDLSLLLELVKDFLKDSNNRDDIQEALKMFDRNGTGYIYVQDLRRHLTSHGEKLTLKEVDELLEEIYVDGHGRIKYQDLVNLLIAR
ncbi:uncharacterized protein [Centruroides vittatus]|uniref:uncharacterized protein n=1 Tax=Centruroides vittatus TaxID=120091 RepID=UPI00351038EC